MIFVQTCLVILELLHFVVVAHSKDKPVAGREGHICVDTGCLCAFRLAGAGLSVPDEYNSVLPT